MIRRRLYVEQIHNPEWGPVPPDDSKPRYVYKVTKLTNATYPNIMQVLTRDELEGFCDSEEWELTIT